MATKRKAIKAGGSVEGWCNAPRDKKRPAGMSQFAFVYYGGPTNLKEVFESLRLKRLKQVADASDMRYAYLLFKNRPRPNQLVDAIHIWNSKLEDGSPSIIRLATMTGDEYPPPNAYIQMSAVGRAQKNDLMRIQIFPRNVLNLSDSIIYQFIKRNWAPPHPVAILPPILEEPSQCDLAPRPVLEEPTSSDDESDDPDYAPPPRRRRRIGPAAPSEQSSPEDQRELALPPPVAVLPPVLEEPPSSSDDESDDPDYAPPLRRRRIGPAAPSEPSSSSSSEEEEAQVCKAPAQPDRLAELEARVASMLAEVQALRAQQSD